MIAEETLVHRLERWCRSDRERPALSFLDLRGDEVASLDRRTLGRRCRALAAVLAERAAPGERALLLHPPGPELAVAFLACLYAGIVAVPAPPPNRRRDALRVRLLARDARPAWALAGERQLPRLAAELDEIELEWLASDDPALVAGGEARAAGFRPPDLDADDLAFLQYTSGSTGDPKGVCVTHANLLANLETTRRAFGMSERSVVVGWLPLYHDMGLIGNLLQPLYSGGRSVLMPPAAFLRRPARWLETIDRYRADTSGGPDFAYRLCAERVGESDKRALDLSCWRLAFDGAEPVRAETLERFAAAFAGCGFDRRAFFPCYGLAEATLFVSGGERREAPRTLELDRAALEAHRVAPPVEGEPTTRLVSSGRARGDGETLVVDPETRRPLPARAVGEVWISGAHVAAGYWRRRELSAEVFGARLANGEGPWLRTGDLAFADDGELFVTGRLKDLIILRGRNLYPQDLERAAEASHRALRDGGAAAFSIDDGEAERLVVVCEIERRREAQADEASSAIRRALAAGFDAEAERVVVLRAGTLPRTSSGKVRRRRCRELLLAGELPALAGAEPAALPARPRLPSPDELAALAPEQRERLLAVGVRGALAAALGVAVEHAPGIGEESALDSLRAVEVRERLADAYGVELPLAPFLGGASAVELARRTLAALAGEIETLPPPPPLAPATAPPRRGPASWGQRSLWLIERLRPGDPAQIVALAASLPAGVDSARLEGAWKSVTARHPALGARFSIAPDGEPEQVLPAPGETPPAGALQRIELPAGTRRERLRERAGEIAFARFDLERGPLARLARLDAGERSLLVLAAHHVAIDLASLAIVLEELAAGVAPSGAGSEPAPARASEGERGLDLDPITLARWQQRLLDGPRGAALEAFWRRELPCAPPELALPFDRPAPARERAPSGGAAVPVALAPQAGERLAQRARELGTTSFTLCLALFGEALGRLAGQRRFALGAPASGRVQRALERVVGYLVNPLPIVVERRRGDTLAALARRLAPRVAGALEHQELPFARLVERLAPSRGARHPVFQAAVAYESWRAPEARAHGEGLPALVLGEDGPPLTLAGLELEPFALDERPCPYDLVLMVAEAPGGELRASWRYRRELFDATSAERMARGFARLVAAALEAPATPLARLARLAAAERQQLLVEANDTDTAYPRDATLDALVVERARRHPAAIAIVGEDGELRYGELVERAARLADRLVSLGAGSGEVLVPVLFERSPGAIVALLGVLMAGGAYLPVDPELPATRRHALTARAAEAASPRLAVAQRGLEDRLPPELAERAIRLDRLGRLDERVAGREPRRDADPGAPRHALRLAYALFTSGSTGEPKAIGVAHRAVVRLLLDNPYWRPRPRETVLHAAPLAFDASTFEIWGALLHGGRLALLPRGPVGARELATTIEARRVTTLWLTAGLFRLVVDEAPGALAGRTVIAGGEVMSPDHWRRGLAAVRPGGRLVNGYGPTEATTFTTAGTSGGDEPGAIPIGRPIGGSRVFVLDAELEPLPLGVAGELCIAGDGLARGYLRDPRATAAAFRPHPLARRPGERLYASGDLARWRPDLALDFLGRLDRQVKVRGFRVEPAEIERVLAGAPGVVSAAVVARPDAAGGMRLVAYCTPASIDVAAARRHLAARLPAPMVPSRVLPLAELPLKPNGKLDEAALPDPENEGQRGPKDAMRAANGAAAELETTVAAAWSRVLGIERVPREQSLFELGGHSLLAARIAAELERELGREVPLIALFDHPTVAGLAAYLERSAAGGDENERRRAAGEAERRAAARRSAMRRRRG